MLNTQVFRFGVHISGICGWNSMSSISNNYPKTLVSEKCLLVWIGPGVPKLFSFKVVHLTRKHPVDFNAKRCQSELDIHMEADVQWL